MFAKSWLFVPGNRPDRFAKAFASGADGVILDLEDAVAPDHKAQARQVVAAFLDQHDSTDGPRVAVRTNPLAGTTGMADLVTVLEAGSGPNFILLPKAEVPEELALVGRILEGSGCATGLIALVENARGVACAPALATAGPRIAALMFGAADYAADLCKRAATYRPDFARASIVNAAAVGGIAAIDSPFFDLADADGLREQCRSSAELGFHGKAAIHPSHIATINGEFAVSEEDRDLARRYLNASIGGVGLVDGKMVDVAMLNWARRIL